MKKNHIFIAVFLIFSCSAQHKLSLQINYYERKVLYVLDIPKPDSIIERKDDDRNKQHLAYFNNGAVLYITDNLNVGGAFLDYKIAKYGPSYPAIYYGLRDTVTLSGVHDGKFWKELKYKKIVVGYYNATLYQKMKFDNVLKGVIPQVDAQYKR